MTAGHGIIHEEYHSTNFAQTGGVLEMFQIWVNLPAKDKPTPPKYQPILKNKIPEVVLPNRAGWVRVVSGNFKGTTGPASTFSPVNLWQVKLEPKVEIDLTTKDGHNTLVFCRSGSVEVAGADLMPSQIVLLSTQGDGVRLRSGEEMSNLMILDGQLLNEPIAARGPFVMNTEAELQVMIDYHTGKMGREL
jgi:hypothetical protein